MTAGVRDLVVMPPVDEADAKRAYWNEFYVSARSGDVPEEPTKFARWVRNRIEPATRIVELGCGSGRDTLWFASKGYDVHAFDFASSAVARVRGAAVAFGRSVAAEELDLSRPDDVGLAASSVLAGGAPRVVYARFVLHSLDDSGQAGLFDLSAAVLRAGGVLFLEFRARQDEVGLHLFGDDHFRTYPKVDDVVAAIESRGGQVLMAKTGQGWAPYRTEDPFVTRIVARWV
jgi:SAM-dependent methyltransferase